MKNNLLPLGTRDEFGVRSEEKQRIIEVIQRHFRNLGFARISTPIIEKQVVFQPYQLVNSKMYRLLDQEGDTIVLRPDLTLPIARFLSSTSIPLPQKFCYVGDIFRLSRSLSGSYNQLTQAGIELVGYQSTKAELECLINIYDLSREILDEQVTIELGYADFAKIFLDIFTTDVNLRKQVAQALFDKKITEYERLISSFEDQRLYPLLKEWPRLFGEPEDIFQELNQYELPKSVTLRLKKIKEIVLLVKQILPKQQLVIDLSSRAPQQYYTGLTFRGFAKSGEDYIFSGGRYDNLLANFQAQNEPAVGMGIDIDLLTDLCVKKFNRIPKTLVFSSIKNWSKAQALVKKLPNATLSLSDTKADALKEAQKLQAKLIDIEEDEDEFEDSSN
ncbi:ATP phosphoribosyltransferase regulatory subunit [Companilactobacillus futsaii]|uniref:ATP phosphoribosyltransferase regulatory subunit n=2 Tax=Companilactobacillus futsaii TaxID=938155 RepID=A0A5B7SWX0_9LACO|nr:ATP phosphoribosyltransferase regulatory subunit [Companilactobacillus futsaii]KRK98951.1 putative histidine--tRNA ligase (putative) [Companilactobacillus futsaii JCM 17355]QCX24187.1 ATP phosphoribosyltransferase regulatory subunit [Companilactobacillus futsaii]